MEESSQSNDGSQNEEKKKVGRPKKTGEKRKEKKSTASGSKVKKQKQPDKVVWGRLVGNVVRDVLPSQRLPTNRVVMQRYHTMKHNVTNRTTLAEYTNMLYREVLPIWEKSNIPILGKKVCTTRIIRLLESWDKQRCRIMEPGSPKEEDYVQMLDSLFLMTYTDKEKVRSELQKQRLLQKDQPQEHEGMKTWEIDFTFFENQMKNPQEGS